jgi:hypothetical protein
MLGKHLLCGRPLPIVARRLNLAPGHAVELAVGAAPQQRVHVLQCALVLQHKARDRDCNHSPAMQGG